MGSQDKAVRNRNPISREDIFDNWMKRLCELDEVVQEHLDSGYVNGGNNHRFRFKPDDRVIALSSGVFYEAKILLPFGARPLSDTSRRLKREDLTKPMVPTYIVHFDGWPASADEEQLENELLSQFADTVDKVHAMLYAHEWNTYFRMEKGLEDTQVGAGSWFLADDVYADLEKLWQTETGMQVPFKKYSGRLKAEQALESIQ